jgi:hypothetical protein
MLLQSLEQTQRQPENKAVSVTPFLGALKIAKSDSWFCHICPSARVPAWNISAPTGRIFHKILYLRIFKKSVSLIKM